MKNFTKYLKGDTVIWIIFFALCIFSIVELYSASSTLAYSMGNHTAPIFQHVFFLIAGAALAFIVHFVPYKYIRIFAYLGIVIAFILLIYLMLKGQDINSASRWIKIFGIQFQPSEIAKLSLIVVVADLISRIRSNPSQENKFFYWILGISGVIIGLILFENFSTAFILGIIIFSMMFIGQISYKKLGIIVGSIALLFILGIAVVKIVPSEKMPNAFERVYTWEKRIARTQQQSDENKYVITDENLQVQHGRIAVARGGFFGVLPGNSIERDYLPHAYDDFIYAIIIEELGLGGGILIMLLYLWLLFRTGQIATVCRSTFPAMLVTGLGLLITLQAAVNMFVGSGFGLVTGQPLPLISRGGTSIMITSIYFGIILGVIREIKSTEEKLYKQQNPIVDDLEENDELVVELGEV